MTLDELIEDIEYIEAHKDKLPREIDFEGIKELIKHQYRLLKELDSERETTTKEL